MKKLFAFILMAGVLKGLHADETMPCCTPPFISNVVKPNVMIVLDMTGSMQWRAANVIDPDGNGPLDPGDYSPFYTYYGYFHPDSIYKYQSNIWKAVGYDPNHVYFNPNQDRYSGNILNWASMSRIDVARKVLTGGAGQPTTSVDKNKLEGFGFNWYYGSDTDGWPCYLKVGNTWFAFTKPYYPNYGSSGGQGNLLYLYKYQWGHWYRIKTYRVIVDVSNVPLKEKCGVIRQIADKDLDGNWDPEAPRFGLFMFSTTQYGIFKVVYELYQSDDDPDMEPFFSEINNNEPWGGTHVGNAVFETIHYLRYCHPHYSGTYSWNINQVGGRKDPWYTADPTNPQPVWCRNTFVVIIGDGESNSDQPVPDDPDHLPPGPFPGRYLCNYYTGTEKGYINSDCNSGGDDPADDYAYYAHITDLRPDSSGPFPYRLPCPQTLTFYSIFAFGAGEGAILFQDIAALGGFEDQDGDLVPDGYPSTLTPEWDEDGDKIPDNYYNAQSGSELENAIREILTKILAGASSASQASVVSQTSKGEGIGTFALFYPRKDVGGGRFISWLGEIKGLWVDKFGFLREETQGNLFLNLKQDYIINFASPDTVNQCDPQNVVYVYRYKDTTNACTGQNLEFVDQITLDQLKPLWDGGKFLWNMSPNERTIKAGIDKNNNGIIEGNEWEDFTTANVQRFSPYLDVYSQQFAETLINYIRGVDYPNLRDRIVNGKAWKLGDIIYSSPMFVQEPMERYDLLYLDNDYKDFYEAYKDRRGVVYVGANDGMVHAFNVGRYVEDETSPCEPGYVDPMGIPIGKEMWAYIPFNLLPHLKWLPDPDYCHVYYVDLKPYPTDAKIFTPDPKHIGGFGTLLIGSARLGGEPYNVNGRVLSSSYFCIDVTDPADPVVLWERNLPDYSYTTPYPNVVKVGDKWFLVIGSGPQLCSGFSDKNGKIYILNLKTGNIVKTFTVPEANSAIGDIISVDIDLDYNVDLIYFGTYYYTGNQNNPNWQGKIYRIKTHSDPNPNNWDLELVIDLGKPITAPGSATMDRYGNLWIYFGSGRLFYDGDEEDTEEQVFVGIKDDTISTYTINDLVDVTDAHVYGDTVKWGGSTISWQELVDSVRSKDGWYRRLTDVGERCLSRPVVIGGAVIFTTYNPVGGGICEFGGLGKLYALFYLTGTAYYTPILGQAQTGENVPSVELGGGVPSEPTMWIGAGEEKAVILIGGKPQMVETPLPYNPRGGVILWKGR